MNNSSPGNRFGEGTSGATPHLDQDQPGPSHENVQDEFFESDSDEEEVFNLNGNDDDGDDGDDGDHGDDGVDNEDGYDTVRGRKDRLVHDLASCQDASNYNRYFYFLFMIVFK